MNTSTTQDGAEPEPRFPPAGREVDVGSLWRHLVARWWLLTIGVALGALIGSAVIHGRRENYKASAEIYVGDTAPPDQLATNLALVSQYVTTESALRTAARNAHLAPAQLRGNITTNLVRGPIASRLGAPTSALIDITVSGVNARDVVEAANTLARAASALMASYPRQQLKLTHASLVQEQALLKDTTTRLNSNLRLRQQLGSAVNGTSTGRQGIITALTRNIGTEIKQQALLRQETLAARLQATYDQTMSARVTRTAEAIPQGIPSRTSSILVGALIGLLLTGLTAIAWQPQPGRP